MVELPVCKLHDECTARHYDVEDEAIVIDGVKYQRHIIFTEDIYLQTLTGNTNKLNIHIFAQSQVNHFYAENIYVEPEPETIP